MRNSASAGPCLGTATVPKISDPRMLRGIAHPMRNRILEEMSAGGPMRAADVAERLDIPANQASFHLRQLAKYGLVEEAPELARDGATGSGGLTYESGLSVNLEELADQDRAARRPSRCSASSGRPRPTRRSTAPTAPERQKDAMVAVSHARAAAHQGRGARSWPRRSATWSTEWREKGQERTSGPHLRGALGAPAGARTCES